MEKLDVNHDREWQRVRIGQGAFACNRYSWLRPADSKTIVLLDESTSRLVHVAKHPSRPPRARAPRVDEAQAVLDVQLVIDDLHPLDRHKIYMARYYFHPDTLMLDRRGDDSSKQLQISSRTSTSECATGGHALTAATVRGTSTRFGPLPEMPTRSALPRVCSRAESALASPTRLAPSTAVQVTTRAAHAEATSRPPYAPSPALTRRPAATSPPSKPSAGASTGMLATLASNYPPTDANHEALPESPNARSGARTSRADSRQRLRSLPKQHHTHRPFVPETGRAISALDEINPTAIRNPGGVQLITSQVHQVYLVARLIRGEAMRITHKARVALCIAFIVTIAGCGGNDSSAPGNTAPVASVGANQSVATGTSVTLNGSASSDADGDPLTFAWSLTTKPAGSTANLAGATTATPTFTPDIAGTYIASLTVNDGKVNSAPATVTITATTGNAAPIANAGPAQNVTVGNVVTLNGSASSDANGDPLTFAWSLTTKPAGSTANLAGATTATPTFTPDIAGTYIASLTVNDGKVNSAPATVSITAAQVAPPSGAFFLFGGTDNATYLGCLTCNEHDAESVCNQFGTYGSQYSATSIWNQYGTYGSQYSSSSPWNRYSMSGPVIIGSDTLSYGYFTTNEFQSNRTTIPAFVSVLDFFSSTLDLAATRTYACGN